MEKRWRGEREDIKKQEFQKRRGREETEQKEGNMLEKKASGRSSSVLKQSF